MIIDQLFLCVLIVGITKNLLIMKNVIIANIQKQIVKQIIGLVKNVLIAVFLIITDNVPSIAAVADLELQNFKLRTNVK